MENKYYLIINKLHPYLEKQKDELMPFIETFFNKQIQISAFLYNNLLTTNDFIITPSLDEDLKNHMQNFEELFIDNTSIKITSKNDREIWGELEGIIKEEGGEPF